MGHPARFFVVMAFCLASCASSLDRHVRDLRDEDPDVRRAAAGALSEMREEATPAVPALIEALADGDSGVRWNAAAALGRIGPAAEPAVPALVTALTDESLGVRQTCVWALRRIGAEKAVSSLVKMLRTGPPGLRWSAAVSLGKMGSVAVSALPALRAALTDPDDQVRIQRFRNSTTESS